jgi:hypothetical protein
MLEFVACFILLVPKFVEGRCQTISIFGSTSSIQHGINALLPPGALKDRQSTQKLPRREKIPTN